MSVKKKILFVIGSPNQTTQMHQIAQQLPEYDCWFSQIYDEHWYADFGIKMGWLDHTIVTGHFKAKGDKYLANHSCRLIIGAKNIITIWYLCVLTS